MQFQLINPFRCREFLWMWLAMVVSTSGTFLFLLALSGKVYLASQSGLQAGSVFAIQWLPSFILFPVIGYTCNRFLSRTLLIWSELLGAAITMLIAIISETSIVALVGLLFVRGFFEVVTKTSRWVALRLYLPSECVEQAPSFFNTSYFIGSGLGGLIGAMFVNHLSLLDLAWLNVVTFLLSAFLYSRLPIIETSFNSLSSFKELWTTSIGVLSKKPLLLISSAYLLLTAGVFQGFHSIARIMIPIELIQVGIQGVNEFQVVSSCALILGSVFVGQWMCRGKLSRVHPQLLILLTSLLMVSTLHVRSHGASLFVYFIFIFIFEVTFTKLISFLVANCPIHALPLFMAFNQTSGMVAIVAVILSFGIAIDHYGLSNSSHGLVVVALLIAMATFIVEILWKGQPINKLAIVESVVIERIL